MKARYRKHFSTSKAQTRTAGSGSAQLKAGTSGVKTLGPVAKVAEVMSQWLRTIDRDESQARH